MADDLKWPLKGFREAFAEVFREGMAKADWEAGVVLLEKALIDDHGEPRRSNRPQSPNVIKSWVKCWDQIPPTPLKAELLRRLEVFTKGISEAFHQAFKEAFAKALVKASPNQESGDRKQEAGSPPISPKGDLAGGSSRKKLKPGEATPDERAIAMRVLGKVGERNGISYQGSEPHVMLIARHLRDGLTERELRGVAAYVWSELGWGDKDEMRPHFVPETLFGPKKIHKYLPGARTWLSKVFAEEPKRVAEPALVIDLFKHQESA